LTTAGLPVDQSAVSEGGREESARGVRRAAAPGRHLPHPGDVHRRQHGRRPHRHVRQRRRPHPNQLRGQSVNQSISQFLKWLKAGISWDRHRHRHYGCGYRAIL